MNDKRNQDELLATLERGFFDWRNPHFKVGMIGSAVWMFVGILILACAGNWDAKLKPNEWGDVFAGLAAPVAFLWLVLGFLQQGRELSAQIIEIKRSVVHQGELVTEARKQLAADLRKEQAERRQRQPFFTLGWRFDSRVAPMTHHRLNIVNSGALAANIEVASVPALSEGHSRWTMALLDTGKGNAFPVTLKEPLPAELKFEVTFDDPEGGRGKAEFVGTLIGNEYDLRRIEATPVASTV